MNNNSHNQAESFEKTLGKFLLGCLGLLISVFVDFISGIVLLSLPILNDLKIFKHYKSFFQFRQAEKNQREESAAKFFWVAVCFAGSFIIYSFMDKIYDYLPFPHEGTKLVFFAITVIPLSFIPYIINRKYWYFMFLAIAIKVFFLALQT
jgi:hypothetical protein